MGLRRRVSIGFISIVGVLILSGMVSFFELNSLSRGTDKILDANAQYGLLSGTMIDALNDHNRAFVQMVAFDDRSFDTLCLSSIARLNSALILARSESLIPELVDSLRVVADELREVTVEYMDSPMRASVEDNVSVENNTSNPLVEDAAVVDSLPQRGSFRQNMYDKYIPIHDKMLTSI